MDFFFQQNFGKTAWCNILSFFKIIIQSNIQVYMIVCFVILKLDIILKWSVHFLILKAKKDQ